MYIFTSCEGFSPKSIEIGLEYAVERKSPMGNIDTGIDEKIVVGMCVGISSHPVFMPTRGSTEGEPAGNDIDACVEVES